MNTLRSAFLPLFILCALFLPVQSDAGDWERLFDANGDGTSDILYQHSTDGRLLIWTMNNGIKSLNFPNNIAATWDVVGKGDFNGDGTGDVLYMNGNGETAIAEMNNAARSTLAFPGGINPIWNVQGVGDFNGDGTDDILWRRRTDHITMIWGMSNSGRAKITFPGGLSNFWKVAGVGDFNNNGVDDILYQHYSDGRLLLWEMSNYTRKSLKFVPSIANTWQVVGIGDFNNDGTDDVLYRKDDGNTAIAEFRNLTRSALKFPGGVATKWTVKDVGDYNGDGTDDILLRRSTDHITMIWSINNSTRTNIKFPGGLAAQWEVQTSHFEDNNSLFPLETGDTWTYDVVSSSSVLGLTEDTITHTVTGPTTFNGVAVIGVLTESELNGHLMTSYNSLESNGYWGHGGDGTTFSPPILAARDGMLLGETFEGSSIVKYDGGESLTLNYTLTYLGEETVVTPMGSFESAKAFQTVWTWEDGFVDTRKFWLQPGVGLVKQTLTARDSSGSFFTTVNTDLTSMNLSSGQP